MPERLPHILQEVADIAGLGAALQLARAYGGRELYVPQRPTPKLVGEIGQKAADALAQLYPNENIMVPLGPEGALKRARKIAAEALARGASAGEAALLSGFTERTMYNHKARRRAKVDTGQGSLFDDPKPAPTRH